MLQRLGVIVLVLGLLMGDSENLMVPAVMLVVGIALMCIGGRKKVDHASGKKKI